MKATAIYPMILFCAQVSAAQAEDWTYAATIYGWLPGMTTAAETRFGTIEGESSASDALSNIDMVFMGTIAAQRGRWGFLVDLLYLDLSNTKSTPLPLFGDARTGLTATSFSSYALYRVSSDPAVAVDIGAGFRAFDLDLDVELGPGILPGESASLGGSWVDPLLVARLSVPLDDSWSVTGVADWGGTGNGDETWQLLGSIKYQINEKWSGQLGYRKMEINKKLGGNDVSVDLGGPVAAVSFRF